MNIDPWHVFTTDFGHMPKPYTAFVTLIDIVLYFATLMQVGKARKEFKVFAPSTDGPEDFQRVFRVQMNTVEALVFHLPLLWLAAFAMDDVFAAAFGILWSFGRILYARGYYKKAKRRGKGFAIGMLVNAVLLVSCLASIIASF